MRRLCLTAALLLGSFSFTFSQTVPSDPSVAQPGTGPTVPDTARPQNQTPPDEKAPPPIAGANPSAESTSAQSAPTPSAAARYLIAGTDIRASLDTPLSTKTSKVGDRFTATISAPVHDASGNIVVPIGSKLNGQISEPSDQRLAGAIKDMGHLNLRFTDIQLPSGTDVPLNATLLSIHNSRPAGSSNPGNSRLTGSAAIAANGGFTGGLGRPIKGLAVGNLAGGGYVLSTSSKQVELPAECVLRLRVDRNTPAP